MPDRDPALVASFLDLGPDGTVTIASGKVELGTGVATALSQVVAGELGVPLDRIRIVLGDTALTPDQGTTAGSKTLQVAGPHLRQAAISARRELLANCQKHSRASCVEVSMARRGKDVCIIVEDDGVGFTESSEQADSFGLFNVRERLRHEGASLQIDSAPGRGSRLEIVAPLEPEAAR